MKWPRPRSVRWSPTELPCAPRPINGELLSSWLRRVAAANDITLPEIEACIGRLMGNEEAAGIPDLRPSKEWRLAAAALTRIPERWVWVLGLEQHFPAAGSDSFLRESTKPHGIAANFCPECFYEQIGTKKSLHMKAEWSLMTTTRCFKHHLPLYLYCPWCGADAPVQFRGANRVECFDCQQELSIRRWRSRMPICEPEIAAFEQTVAEALAGKAPDPRWVGEMNAAPFLRLVNDLIGFLTSEEFGNAYFGIALVDRIVPCRFAPREPYGWDLETPFLRRSWVQREAVIAAIVLILRGEQADRALGVAGLDLQKTAEFRPFVEVLQFVGEQNEPFWKRVRGWPGDIQDRTGGAIRYLQNERAMLKRRNRKRAMA